MANLELIQAIKTGSSLIAQKPGLIFTEFWFLLCKYMWKGKLRSNFASEDQSSEKLILIKGSFLAGIFVQSSTNKIRLVRWDQKKLHKFITIPFSLPIQPLVNWI